jgi:putative ABC transport system permease protein
MDPRTVSRPPRLAEALLRRCLPAGTTGLTILGDLHEEYLARIARGQGARAWYWGEALSLALRYRLRRHTDTKQKRGRWNVSSDVKIALRTLARSPAMCSLIVLTLGTAMGASTIGFAFADFAVVRGLPVDDTARVVAINGIDARQRNGRARLSAANFRDMKDRVTTLERFSASVVGRATVIDRGIPASLDAGRSTADFFAALGLKPFAGRLFQAGDDQPGAQPVVVVAHQYWQRVLGEDPNVLGRALLIDGRTRTVVGIAPPELELGNLAPIDVWLPLEITATASRTERTLPVLARLRPGVSLEQARAEVATIARGLATEFPQDNKDWQAMVVPIGEVAYGPGFWVVITLFIGAVALVIVIACANAASLVLARAIKRQREMALRSALGANRARLLRQAVIEGLVLSAASAVVAVPTAEWGLRAIRGFNSAPDLQQLVLDWHELGFVGLVALITPVLFSLLPTLGAIRLDLTAALQSGSARAGAGPARGRTALVAVQLSLAVTLLIAAGLALRTEINMSRLDLGMRTAGALVYGLGLQNDAAPVPEPRRLIDDTRDRLGRLPGVISVHVFESTPVLSAERVVPLAIDGRSDTPEQNLPWALLNGADAGALRGMNVPLLAGRMLTEQEERQGAGVALAGQTMATMYFGAPAAAIGKALTIDDRGESRRVEIVGVVGDVLSNDIERGRVPRLWTGLHDLRRATIVVVTGTNPRDLAAAVRREMVALAPMLPLDQLETLDAAFARFRASDKVIIGVFAGFALLALLLAATGLYGLIAYTVGQRVAEFGTRFALGARPSDVLKLVFGQVARLIAIGLGVGVLAGLAVGQGMRSVLYGVSAADPVTIGGVVVLISAIALAASVRPALSAARINLVDALKSD